MAMYRSIRSPVDFADSDGKRGWPSDSKEASSPNNTGSLLNRSPSSGALSSVFFCLLIHGDTGGDGRTRKLVSGVEFLAMGESVFSGV